MTENHDPARKGLSRRSFLSTSAASAVAASAVTVPLISRATIASAAPVQKSALAANQDNSALQAMLNQIDPGRIHDIILRLTQFGTRHTASSLTDPVRGIGAATTWVTEQFQAIADNSNGNLTVQQQTFSQPPVPNRLPQGATITNVIATLQGTASPQRFYVVTGHLDSRVTDLLDFTSDAPGADDDGSGVAIALELARVFANADDAFPGTLVFATVSGEEEGLFGSTFMAQQMAGPPRADVQGMFSNDIAGASQSFDGHPPDPFTVRLFLEGIPSNFQPSQIGTFQAVGGENDGLSRQLGRFVADVAPFELTGMNIRRIWRRDRYLRASDHVSFQGQGYPAARFTEPRENFNHEHRNVEVINGVQFGDLIDFVDFDYVARVAKVNGAALWNLATAPGTPKNVLIHVNPPVGFAGNNVTTLTWNANPEPNLVGYEVVTRETTVPDWTNAIPVGNVTTVALDIAKDNVQFGVRAVDSDGNRSPVGFPQISFA